MEATQLPLRMSEKNLKKVRFRGDVGDPGGVQSMGDFVVGVRFLGGATVMGPTISPSPSSGNLPHLSSISGMMIRLTGFSKTALVWEFCISVSLSLSFFNTGDKILVMDSL